MLFNSYTFILGFLPVVLILFHGLRNLGWQRGAFAALAASSLVFYGWWSLQALAILLVLLVVNYLLVLVLVRGQREQLFTRKMVLALAVLFNLGVLGYFKYANFFLDNWQALIGTRHGFLQIVLPLGLSFFTFQKIALLVDAYRGKVQGFDPLGYVLFVSFFPQLIAGPIVHHSEVMPQFAAHAPIAKTTIAQGLTLFVIGLAKKVLIADSISQTATAVFNAAAAGHAPATADAWIGSVAYALQLYFDFSGYSDMAIGLALMFGIRLPINFAAPYKAASIIEFWRCWHMTLSRFLRDYLYIPLGGSRHGAVRRYVNLFATMLLGGLWHGAAWTFVFWGGLHGAYLIVNHGWRAALRRSGIAHESSVVTRTLARGLTFLAVLVGWVFFRADNLTSASLVLKAMIGLGGSSSAIASSGASALALACLLAIVWLTPTSSTLVAYAFEKNACPEFLLTRRRMRVAALACGVLFALCLMSLTRVTEFLYFQF